ncbi:MAG TPA: response regulator [Gemmatimonadales bacterium]|jgi:CheY-like chemotaxis protein|nr:response regulator [Gemmatimonadales bacterium]
MDSQESRPDPGPTLTILVVEDSRKLRDTIAAELRRHGCRVVSAAHGTEALEAVVLDRFDAIVTDVQMLPRGGLWLWREATTLRPELRGRFVFCSSSGAQAVGDGPWRSERFVPQPLRPDILWAEVVAVTDQQARDVS